LRRDSRVYVGATPNVVFEGFECAVVFVDHDNLTKSDRQISGKEALTGVINRLSVPHAQRVGRILVGQHSPSRAPPRNGSPRAWRDDKTQSSMRFGSFIGDQLE
jgi:hypothetical protein